MSHSLHIGGISYSLAAPEGVELVSPDPLYVPFRESPPSQPNFPELRVDVRFGRGVPTRLKGRPILFDTGESWFAQRDDEDLILLQRGPQASEDLLWSARLSGDRRSVEVACGDPLWKDGRNQSIEDPFIYPLDQLVTMMVLARRQRGALIHAAGVIHHQRAIAFAGVSGAGKSTLVSVLGDAFNSISDDRVIIRVDGEGIILFGTPWVGEGRAARAQSAPLAALAFLRQATVTEARPLTKQEALRQLLPTLSVPWFEEHAATDVLAVAEKLLESVPAYELHFRPDQEVQGVIRNLL